MELMWCEYVHINPTRTKSGSRYPQSVIDVKYSINGLAQIWRLLHTLQNVSVYLLFMDLLPICMTILVLPPLVTHCGPPQQERQYFHFPVLVAPHFWPITWIVSVTSSAWWMFEEVPTWSVKTFLTSCGVGWSLEQNIVVFALDHLITCL